MKIKHNSPGDPPAPALKIFIFTRLEMKKGGNP
jgi:hypothetical protein